MNEMAGFLFPNSSYFISFAASGEFDACLERYAKKNRCRMFFCQDLASFEGALKVMRRKLGCILFVDSLSQGDQQAVVALVKKYRLPHLILSKSAQPALMEAPILQISSEETVEQALDSLMTQWVPKQLGRLAVFSSNLIIRGFFSELGEFQEAPLLNEGYDRQVVYYTVSGDLLGLCSVKVNLKRLSKLKPNDNEEKIMGDLKEAVNQFLGIISLNLAKVDIHMKIGLPTLFNLEHIPEVQTLVTFPSVYVTDVQKCFFLSLGYSNLSNGPLFDLSNVEPEGPSGDIELL